MVVAGFSKVADIIDEDDEREQAVAQASAKFRAAQEAFDARTKGGEELLQRFEEAEALMKPYLQGGLAGLSAAELGMVLKGRLHQAVLLSQCPTYPGRWEKIKGLVEQILQYDCCNFHAHYLRGLALEHGDKRIQEGRESMKQAVDYAQQQGRAGELAKLQQVFDQSQECPPADGEPVEEIEELEELEEAGEELGPEPVAEGHPAGGAADRPPPANAEPAPAEPKAKAKAAPAEAAPVPAPKSGIRKGFFNRPSGKAAAGAGAAAPAAAATASAGATASTATASAARGEPAKASAADAGDKPKPASAQAVKELEEARAEQDRLEGELRALREQLEDAQQLGKEDADRARAAEDRLEEWQQRLCEQLGGLAAEFEEEAPQGEGSSGPGGAESAAEAVRAAAAKVQEQLEESRKWGEDAHQRLLDLGTEVATIREMAKKELHERQDASAQQIREVRALTGHLDQLKAAAKALRDQGRRKGTIAEQHAEAEKDVHQLADRVADFHALPARTKLAAMLDDAAVLRLAAFAFLLGLLLMLGITAELLGPTRCRLACAA
mmetsp:Transcript_80782/g.249212  ORF Transcript_80782/g.249212 Transcript_80782/m.249212 type:complete len:553 (+) Transcript_80782:107-1765(+)